MDDSRKVEDREQWLTRVLTTVEERIGMPLDGAAKDVCKGILIGFAAAAAGHASVDVDEVVQYIINNETSGTLPRSPSQGTVNVNDGKKNEKRKTL